MSIKETSYLGKNGYVIKKEYLSNEELLNLKIELQAKPLVDDSKYFTKSTQFPVYIETKNKIYIPKMYGINKYGFPNKVLDSYNGKKWENEITFNGTLMENQIIPTNTLIKACHEVGGGILHLSTGFGKTFCALFVLSILKMKTIVIVNKIPLMNQWKSEIQRFLPNANVGTLQGQKNINIQNCDIVIAMLQSMSRIDYPQELFQEFGVLIIDEVHNLSSRVFSQILFKLCSKYTIGLSATPKRADGCEYVFLWHIGDIVYKSKEKREGKQPIIRILKIDSKEYKEISIENKLGVKQLQFTSMLSELIEMKKRNLLIIELIKNIIINDENRKILLLTDRRNHVFALKELLDNDLSVTFTSGLFIGNMSENELEISKSSQLIIASFSAFSEGVSIKDLDTLILTTPKKFIGHLKNTIKNESFKLEQIVGRIFRKEHTERNPIIIDLFDNFSVYKSQGNSRIVFYKQHFTNGIFEEHSINLDEHNDVKINYIKIKQKKEKKDIDVENNKSLNKLLEYCILDD